jgi:hypothetical protein
MCLFGGSWHLSTGPVTAACLAPSGTCPTGGRINVPLCANYFTIFFQLYRPSMRGLGFPIAPDCTWTTTVSMRLASVRQSSNKVRLPIQFPTMWRAPTGNKQNRCVLGEVASAAVATRVSAKIVLTASQADEAKSTVCRRNITARICSMQASQCSFAGQVRRPRVTCSFWWPMTSRMLNCCFAGRPK